MWPIFWVATFLGGVCLPFSCAITVVTSLWLAVYCFGGNRSSLWKLRFTQENRGLKTQPDFSHTLAWLHLKRSRGEELLWLTFNVYHSGTKSCVRMLEAEEAPQARTTGIHQADGTASWFGRAWALLWLARIFEVGSKGYLSFSTHCLPVENLFSLPKTGRTNHGMWVEDFF